MPYVLNGEPLSPSRGFSIGDTNYTGAELIHWPHDDLIALGLEWVQPEPPAPDMAGAAQQLLAASDIVVLRCYEAGLAVPVEWVAYREALRAVVRGDSGTLPERPEYPE